MLKWVKGEVVRCREKLKINQMTGHQVNQKTDHQIGSETSDEWLLWQPRDPSKLAVLGQKYDTWHDTW